MTSSDEMIVLLMAVAPSHSVATSPGALGALGVGCGAGGLIGFSAG